MILFSGLKKGHLFKKGVCILNDVLVKCVWDIFDIGNYFLAKTALLISRICKNFQDIHDLRFHIVKNIGIFVCTSFSINWPDILQNWFAMEFFCVWDEIYVSIWWKNLNFSNFHMKVTEIFHKLEWSHLWLGSKMCDTFLSVQAFLSCKSR